MTSILGDDFGQLLCAARILTLVCPVLVESSHDYAACVDSSLQCDVLALPLYTVVSGKTFIAVGPVPLKLALSRANGEFKDVWTLLVFCMYYEELLLMSTYYRGSPCSEICGMSCECKGELMDYPYSMLILSYVPSVFFLSPINSYILSIPSSTFSLSTFYQSTLYLLFHLLSISYSSSIHLLSVSYSSSISILFISYLSHICLSPYL